MRASVVVLVVTMAACGGEDALRDAEVDGGASCADDLACDDGVFCNGAERCDPSNASADARGCVSASESPCSAGGICFELDRTCRECPDADGDGFADVRCGGTDCDDADPAIHPAATEVCDPDHVDEDCDPSTLAGPEGDVDGDGYVSTGCCNPQPSGRLSCGDDCDDADPSIHPGALEICDMRDNDCDGRVDENPTNEFCRDLDSDGFGDPLVRVVACFAPPGFVTNCTDCDDTRAFVYPGATEICDEGVGGNPPLDENCNGSINEGCACVVGAEMACGPALVGACRPGLQMCEPQGGGDARTEWSACVGAVLPRAELCNGVDDDCDGAIDEDFECVGGEVATGTNRCGRSGTRVCTDGCRWDREDFGISNESVSTCDYCDDTGFGIAAELAVATQQKALSLGASATAVGHWVSSGAGGYLAGPTGGAFFAQAETLGHRLSARVGLNVERSSGSDTTSTGWAFAVVEGPDVVVGELGAGQLLGVPQGRDGLAVEWHLARPGAPARVLTRALRATAHDPVEHEASVGTDREMDLRVTIEPDLPRTDANETRVLVEQRTGRGAATSVESQAWERVGGCGGVGEPPCGVRLVAGRSYRFGVTATTSTASTFSARAVDLALSGLCR
ncbi:MAG: putative metal-binding motif-containing protein [Myxococcales bacterium]|nr:putative metal-binding motif-containing protein [Myxococcales bacterium]